MPQIPHPYRPVLAAGDDIVSWCIEREREEGEKKGKREGGRVSTGKA